MVSWPYFVLAGGVLLLDRLSKYLVAQLLSPGESFPLTGFLSLTRVHNPGGAFGVLAGGGRLFVVISAGVALWLGVGLWRGWLPGRPARLGGTLLLAGAAGNLIDRLAYGYVVDFLDLGWFPVFNLADAAVVVGAALLAAGTLLSPTRKPDSEHHEPS